MHRSSSLKPRLKLRHGTKHAHFLSYIRFQISLLNSSICRWFCFFLSSLIFQPLLSQGVDIRYFNNLRLNFSVSQKTLCRRARGYLSEESRFYFCSPLISNKFPTAATNLSFFIPIGLHRVANPMLKHLPHSGKNHLLHIQSLLAFILLYFI